MLLTFLKMYNTFLFNYRQLKAHFTALCRVQKAARRKKRKSVHSKEEERKLFEVCPAVVTSAYYCEFWWNC